MNARILKLRSLALFAAGGMMLLCLLSPVTALAAGQQVDVCGSSNDPNLAKDIADCNSFVDKYINPLVVVLTALVGITAVISIIMAGIQYSASADDSGVVTKAKQRIFNTIIGLVGYIFMLALLNYLIPGGFF